MLLRDLVLRHGCCWPSLLLHCALHPLWGLVQVTHAEPQKSCSKVTDSCQHICQCRPPPPLPPPPPPPPPPRLLSAPAPNSTSCPAEDSWWSGLVIIVAVVCASLVFLTVLVIICYKAIKSSQLYLLPCRGQLVVWSGDHCRCGLCLPGVSDCPGHHLLQSHKEEPGHLKKAFCGLCLAWWDQPRLARRLEDRKES
uniref:Proline-rich membrane anchor 1 n=1 Tax=Mus musculus TaxID=10090 RepID=Q3USW1_MOUSE|nr:unnamed protein product [Mus musculus]